MCRMFRSSRIKIGVNPPPHSPVRRKAFGSADNINSVGMYVFYSVVLFNGNILLN